MCRVLYYVLFVYFSCMDCKILNIFLNVDVGRSPFATHSIFVFGAQNVYALHDAKTTTQRHESVSWWPDTLMK